MGDDLESLRVLLVGTGNMAREHARAFLAYPEVSVVGVVGRTREKGDALARELSLPESWTSFSTAFRHLDPHIVVVAVSVPAIREVYPEILATPAVHLVEKPLGLDVAQARAFAILGESDLPQSFVAMNRRSYGNMRAALASLRGRAEVRLVQILDQQTLDFPREMGWPPHLEEQWMYANSIHTIDLLRYFCRGSVTAVTSKGWNGVTKTPSLVSAYVNFDSGDIGTYEATWGVEGPWSLSIATSHERWEMRPLESCRKKAKDAPSWEDLEPTDADIQYKPGLLHQAGQVIQAAKGNKHTLVTLREAVRSMELASQIYTRDQS